MAPPRPSFRRPEVCKPCWELHYCPYGVLVESMPFCETPEERALMKEAGSTETEEEFYQRAKARLARADPADDEEIWRAMFMVMFADPAKKALVQQYDPYDVRCTIFGHTCPVFAHYYLGVTETKEMRRTTRRIPRDIMFQVMRRDDYRCRKCGKNVPDNEVEFDHVIPHAKGGPTSVANIRLLCRGCNRKKGSSLDEILDNEPL